MIDPANIVSTAIVRTKASDGHVAFGEDEYRDQLYIVDKSNNLVKFLPNAVQAHYRANKAKRNIILKPRQVGFTTEIQADMFIEAITKRTRQAVLAHDHVTTAHLRRIASRYYKNLPEYMRPKRVADNSKITVYEKIGSEVTIATAGSLNVGRGGTYTRVHGTEVAYWKDPESILAGLLQGVPENGIVELESTANGPTGWFYDKCMRALSGDSEYKFHFYPWWWMKEYSLHIDPEDFVPDEYEEYLIEKYGLTPSQLNWRRWKKLELPLTFDQEYPETPHKAFILTTGSVFGDVTKALYFPTTKNPIPGHRYVAGVDWGQANDYTALSIIDATTDEEVFIGRWNKMGWDLMQQKIVDHCIHWGVETLQPEKNSIGSVNILYIREKFESRGYRINIRPITTTNKKKRNWVQNFYRGIHTDGLKLVDIDFATAELHGFVQGQTSSGMYTYSADGAGHDDTVIARLLAYDAALKVVGVDFA